MSSTRIVTAEADGYTVTLDVLSVPPPHMMFLASQVESAELSPLDGLAAAGGLTALVVRAVRVDYRDPSKPHAPPTSTVGEDFTVNHLPRDLPGLLALGRGFIMALYDAAPSYPVLGAAFTAVMQSYKAQPTQAGQGVTSPNPT